jgi:hypothetical protein
MIPLQKSASMIPLSSVDVVIGFLLEVERLMGVVVSIQKPFWTLLVTDHYAATAIVS